MAEWWPTYATELLPYVERPSRYINHEINAVHGAWDAAALRVVLAFPDVYEIGISHLGLHILYSILAARDNVAVERCYTPWPDAESLLREKEIPLCTLESCRPLAQADILGFSFQYELCYTNVLAMLECAGIPLRTDARKNGAYPLVIAGGNVYSPGPVAPFIDAFVVGDGEETIVRLVAWAEERKKNAQPLAPDAATLTDLVRTVPGIYAPSLYTARYAEDAPRRVCPDTPIAPDIPPRVEKQFVRDLSAAPVATSVIVPLCEGVHDRGQIEITRGCVGGCRFCQAGMITRPVREKDPDAVVREARTLIAETGFEDLTLSSLSAGDYTHMNEVLQALLVSPPQDMPPVSVSLPSLRMDSFTPQIAEAIRTMRRTGFTFAPEAGTERLRRVINKRIAHEDILRTVSHAAKAGWRLIKLYFMIGLPTETQEDIDGIVTTIKDILDATHAAAGGSVRVRVSISTFVPKPMTPFQWDACADEETIAQKHLYLLKNIPRRVKVSLHDYAHSQLEAAFARGDAQLADVLEEAYRQGCRFDQWHEKCRFDVWKAAFARHNREMATYLAAIPEDAPLPWDVVDCGVTRAFLLRERQCAYAEEETPACREGVCHACGVERWGMCGGGAAATRVQA